MFIWASIKKDNSSETHMTFISGGLFNDIKKRKYLILNSRMGIKEIDFWLDA